MGLPRAFHIRRFPPSPTTCRLPLLAVSLAATTAWGCAGHQAPTAPAHPPGIATVAGHVRYAGGRPASDCTVWLTSRLLRGVIHVDFTSSDSLGGFRLIDVPEGAYFVYATRFSTFTNEDSLVAVDSLGVAGAVVTPTSTTLTLVASGSFAGHARDRRTLAAVAVLVLVDGLPVIARSDSTGAYTLRGIPPGSWTVLGSELNSPYRFGQVTGILPAAGDSVTLPDFLLDSPGSAARPGPSQAWLYAMLAARDHPTSP